MATKVESYEVRPKPQQNVEFKMIIITCDYADCAFEWTDGDDAIRAGVEVPDLLYTDPEDQPIEILVYENPNLCVNSQYKRTYCLEHGARVWEVICAAINADPNEEGRIDDY